MASDVNRWCLGILLVLAIVFPTVLLVPKIIFLLFSLTLTFLMLIRGGVLISVRWILVVLCYVILGVGSSMYGVAVGAPGAVRVLSVMAVYPALFLLLGFTYKSSDSDRLFNVFVLAAWLLIVVDLAYALSNIYFPGNFYVAYIERLYEEGAVIDSEDLYYKFTIPNISSLLFLLPFFLSSFFWNSRGRGRLNLALICFFLLLISIMSGRRALLIAFLAGPLIAYFLGVFNLNKNTNNLGGRKKRWFYVLLAAAAALYFLQKLEFFDFYVSQIQSIFDFENNYSNQERSLQFDALLNGLLDSPFFGSGAGAATSYVRSETQPWAYELSYMALLFQYGIIGFMFYAVGVLYIIFQLRKIARLEKDNQFPAFYLAGMLSFLIANATNPYLAKFDYMWVIFIPVAIIINKKRKTNG